MSTKTITELIVRFSDTHKRFNLPWRLIGLVMVFSVSALAWWGVYLVFKHLFLD